jgi:hypothetical protein
MKKCVSMCAACISPTHQQTAKGTLQHKHAAAFHLQVTLNITPALGLHKAGKPASSFAQHHS